LQKVSLEIIELLKQLRTKAVIGFVGGSDLAKISEQLAVDGKPGIYLALTIASNQSLT
jgi:phosphomannomutase